MVKHILLVYDYFSPAYKAGGPIQSLSNLAAYLGTEYHFSVITGAFDKGEVKLLKDIKENEWNERGQNIKVFYWVPSFFNTGMLIRLLKSRDYNLIYLNGLYSPYFNILPLVFSKNKIVLAPRGMLHPGALSQKTFKKKVYLFLFKLMRWHKKITFHATDKREEAFIKKVFGNTVTVKVASNIPHFIGEKKKLVKEKGRLVLVSVALISPMKNIDLVLQSLQSVSSKIDYHIYGPVKDEPYWNLCREIIKTLPGNITVEFHGATEPDLVPVVIEKAHAFILPSKSENFGHALFESFSSAKPVITSNHTPWNNLAEQKAGWNVDTSTASGLEQVIEELAEMDQSVYNEYCDGAFTLAKKYMEGSHFKETYCQLFSQE